MHPSWSDELKFLTYCARTEIEQPIGDRIYSLSERVGWKEVMRLARFHRVMPLLHQATKAFCSENVPSDVSSTLHHEYVGAAARNLRLAHELHDISNRLSGDGVRAIFFKGPILAQQAYRNLGLRGSGDIDLYIKPSDFAALEKCLRENGYRPVKAVTSKGDVDANALRIAGQCPFIHDEHPWSLDVHTALMPPGYSFSIDFDVLYTRSIQVPIGNGEALGFSTEDLLQILCLHGAKNRWEALKHVCDVAELLRSQPDLNWEDVLASAHKLSGARILFVGLRLAHEVLDARLEDDIRELVYADTDVAQLTAGVEEYLGYSHKRIISGAERLQFHFKIQDTMRGRARYGMYVLLRRMKDVLN